MAGASGGCSRGLGPQRSLSPVGVRCLVTRTSSVHEFSGGVSMTTSSEIADLAERYEGLVLALTMAWPLILHPAHPLAEISAVYLAGGGPGEDLPFYLKDAPDDPEPIVLSTKETFERAAASAAGIPKAKIRVLSIAMGAAVTHLHDEIKAAKLHDHQDPLLEFLRHFRNACAHGDRWHFTGAEPRHAAHFGDLVLSKDLNGQYATFDTVGPKSFVSLLRAVRDHFLTAGGASQ